MSNHVDRFYAAISVIVGHGDIKQRLICAFEDHLAIIEDDELPQTVKDAFTELRSQMTGVEPLNGEGHIRATVRKMSVVEADDCARRMLDLFSDLVRLHDDADGQQSIQVGETPRIPPFLVKSANT